MNFSCAPDWAGYAAQDATGQWWFYEFEPIHYDNKLYEKNEFLCEWQISRGSCVKGPLGEPNQAWRYSLKYIHADAMIAEGSK